MSYSKIYLRKKKSLTENETYRLECFERDLETYKKEIAPYGNTNNYNDRMINSAVEDLLQSIQYSKKDERKKFNFDSNYYHKIYDGKIKEIINKYKDLVPPEIGVRLELKNYSNSVKKEQTGFFSFFSKIKKTKENKSAAAHQLAEVISGKREIINADYISDLTNGRLGGIVDKYKAFIPRPVMEKINEKIRESKPINPIIFKGR